MVPASSPHPRGTFFPIAEVYGYSPSATSTQARKAWDERLCPFAGGVCEKSIQYPGMGYCSVKYAAAWDSGVPKPYAVCDHRLDGDPIREVAADAFPVGVEVAVYSEVTIATRPSKFNVDYILTDASTPLTSKSRLVAVETQAIDIRGGGVGPAMRAWNDGAPEKWRSYFTDEVQRGRRRRDTVDYGINTSNVHKRIGTQILQKSQLLGSAGIPMYVVMQTEVLEQLHLRVPFKDNGGAPSDINFLGFSYSSPMDEQGRFSLRLNRVLRTTLGSYLAALQPRLETSDLLTTLVPSLRRKDPKLSIRLGE